MRLEEMRRKRKLTQVELAQRAGVGQSAISEIERGSCKPSFDLLVRLAKALECTLNDLVDLDEFSANAN